MHQPGDKLERILENWRQGRASLEDLRSLAVEAGNRHYLPGLASLIQLLDHEDATVRNNAIVSLAFDFHYAAVAGKLLSVLLKDSDADCRGSAAGGLGNLCRDTKDHNVLDALGKVALSDIDEDVRISAYKALLSVNGLSREEHLRVLTDQGLSVDPAHVEAILKRNF